MTSIDSDFELMIRPISLGYHVCVRYVGSDKLVQKLCSCEGCVNCECLFELLITFQSNQLVHTSYQDEMERVVASYDVHADGVIHSFYNHLYKYELIDVPPFHKLKGIGPRVLCAVLKRALDTGKASVTDVIVLQASGSLPSAFSISDDSYMSIKLVRYYETMGFRQVHPELLELGLKHFYVTMSATVQELLEHCRAPQVVKRRKIQA
jgi:hypothetical protein